MNISLADKREALAEYLTKRDVFSSVYDQEFNSLTPFFLQASGSGVFGFAKKRDPFIQFITLKSVLRGIPKKVWKVSLPSHFQLLSFAICPQADALAVVCWVDM